MEVQIPGPSESYVLVYDAAAAGFHTWTFPLFGLVFVAAGIGAFFIFRNGITHRERIFGRVAGPFLGIVGALWTIAALEGVRSEYGHLIEALQTHRYAVVEGTVSGFVSEGPGGHPPETWQVNGHYYRVSTYEVTSGLGQPGKVHPGEYVRIADVDGTIARIERRVIEIPNRVP